MEGRRTEGMSSMVHGTFAEERERFRVQGDQFRRNRPDTFLHHPAEVVAPPEESPNPMAEALASREGLAQAVLAAEILGKPRALRPYTTRK